MCTQPVARVTPYPAQTQRFVNGEVHDWYRLILGYPDHLVGRLLDEFGVQPGDHILDPFCGAGTTLVEGMKRGVWSTGIEANPSSHFAARVKTNWQLLAKTLIQCGERVTDNYRKFLQDATYQTDPFYRYLQHEGFLRRRWISVKPLRKIIAIKKAIDGLRTTAAYKNALLLALVAQTVHGSANVKFGPELYCGKSKRDSAVFLGFRERLDKMASDLTLVSTLPRGSSNVILGDARHCGCLLSRGQKFSAIISSPPYPAEHDYTRNARLELALLGAVVDRESLRKIKGRMIRSHTKGVYKGDSDGTLVAGHPEIERIARILERRAKSKTHGFARLYSTVLREYFGGMKRHFASVKPFLAQGGLCAYVVGDQSSYLRVHIPTAEILSSLAAEVGYRTVEIRHWRSRWSTATSRSVEEHILILRSRV
jgi:hypothetical protein